VIVRYPAVAGSFYPSKPDELRDAVAALLAGTKRSGAGAGVTPKAVIAPHAGYRYSGPVAGSAHSRWETARETIHRVLLVGPAHRFPVAGVAATSADALASPLGVVRVDTSARDAAIELPNVALCDAAFNGEHSLEVHLPFLQVVLGDVDVVPFLVGHGADRAVADLLDRLWGGAETAVVISSDLSHYHDYATATALDRATADAIVRRDPAGVDDRRACGAAAIRGLLGSDGCRPLSAEEVDLRNSGDTQGNRDQVVGYGAFVFA
jgi:AmmeMemoRadiSam system protein B